MSRTKSTMMLQLGTQAPEFSLPDAHGRLVSRSDSVGKLLLVAFLCNRCAHVARVRHALVLLAKDFMPQGLAVVAINPNSVAGVAAESPEQMVQVAQAAGFRFPYLVDASQRVAKSYRAACTPDFFLFDNSHKLVYRGQFDPACRAAVGDNNCDDAGCARAEPTDAEGAEHAANTATANGGGSLRAAVQAALSKDTPTAQQMPSMGCSIAWQVGAVPPYVTSHADPGSQSEPS